MKYLFAILTTFIPVHAMAVSLDTPDVELNLILDYMHFSGDSAYITHGLYTGENNRFAIRKAGISVSGRAGELVTYEGEAAMASCAGGTGLSVMEAGVFIEPRNSPLRGGIGQLHAVRGFSMGEECGHTLLLEKPAWKTTLAPGCHSLGGILEFSTSVGSAGILSGQAGYFNGSSGTVEEDGDAVIWLEYTTPFRGLSIGGFAESLHLEMDPSSEGAEKGERYGFGVNMDNSCIAGRIEYVSMSGIPLNSRPLGCEEPGTNIENSGLLVQAAYTISPSLSWVSGVTPYAGYQLWDRWSNAAAGNWKYSWLEAGLRLNLESESWLTLGWRTPSQTPEEQPEDSAVLILRMGTEI